MESTMMATISKPLKVLLPVFLAFCTGCSAETVGTAPNYSSQPNCQISLTSPEGEFLVQGSTFRHVSDEEFFISVRSITIGNPEVEAISKTFGVSGSKHGGPRLSPIDGPIEAFEVLQLFVRQNAGELWWLIEDEVPGSYAQLECLLALEGAPEQVAVGEISLRIQ
jgi:hypothetical protein